MSLPNVSRPYLEGEAPAEPIVRVLGWAKDHKSKPLFGAGPAALAERRYRTLEGIRRLIPCSGGRRLP